MKKKFFTLFLTGLIILSYTACNDPVFHLISQEVPKLQPLVNGSPANFVISGGSMYTASGSTLYKLTGTTWLRGSSLPNSPGGSIRQLASTNGYLYAVCEIGNNAVIKRTSPAGTLSWTSVSDINNPQSIFAIGNTLYISSISSDKKTYSIHYLTDGGTVTAISAMNNVSLLIGAAYDGTNYYLCTNDRYYYSNQPNFVSASNRPIPVNDDSFMGITSLGNSGGNKVVAISRNGRLYEISTTAATLIASFDDERLATGALAVWTGGGKNLLLAGRGDISYSTNTGHTYGYVEIEFNSSGIVPADKKFWVPGTAEKATTVTDQSRYVNSIGKNPIKYIIQFPANTGTLFASTQQNGVWSYESRDGVMQWNAVE